LTKNAGFNISVYNKNSATADKAAQSCRPTIRIFAIECGAHVPVFNEMFLSNLCEYHHESQSAKNCIPMGLHFSERVWAQLQSILRSWL